MQNRFEFLEEDFPKLADYGRRAEEGLNVDNNICLLYIGRIAESITKILCERNNIHDYDAGELLKLGIIDEKIYGKINALLEVEDEAANSEYNSEMACSRLILTAEELCRWFVYEAEASKFSFLADLFPENSPIPPLANLALYGKEAEENLSPNTRYALICLGDIEEAVVNFLLNSENLNINQRDNDQSDKINILYREGKISKEINDILHKIRMARNDAVHSRYNSEEETSDLLSQALTLCEWIFKFVMSAGDFLRAKIQSVNENLIEVSTGRFQGIVENEDFDADDVKAGTRKIFKVIDTDGEKISLSLKEVYTNPWINAARRYEKYKIGQDLKVKVTRVEKDIGATVEICGTYETTEARIPENEYGSKKPNVHEEIKARVKWFDPKRYPYMILSVKDAPQEINFIRFCANASPEEIREKISEVDEINKKNKSGMTALMMAALHNPNPEAINILVEAEAKVNSVNYAGNTALILAAMSNTPEVVRALLEHEAEIVILNGKSKSAYDYAVNNPKLEGSDVIKMLKLPLTDKEFLELCKSGSCEEIREAITDVFDINIIDDEGNTALMLACLSNSPEVVNILLEHEADISIANYEGKKAIDFAKLNDKLKDDSKIISRLTPTPTDEEFLALCASGTPEEITQALNAEANINAMDEQNNTVLMIAAEKNNAEAVKILLEEEIDINTQNQDGNTALILASMNNDAETVSAILSHNPDINITNKKEYTALMAAVRYNNPEIVRVLLNADAKLDVVDALGNTALMMAASNNTDEVVKLILEADSGVNVNNCNNSGWNALMMAARTKQADTVRELLQRTSDINAKNNNGDTALIIASEFNNSEVVSAILEANPEINAQNNDGETALMAAVRNSEYAENVLKVLIKAKPDLQIQNNNNHRAVDIARIKSSLKGSRALIIILNQHFLKLCKSGSPEEISEYVNAGVNVNIRSAKNSATPLMFAVQDNNCEAVKILLEANSDINAQDARGYTALILAAGKRDEEMLSLLLEHEPDVNICDAKGYKALNYAAGNPNLKGTEAFKKLKELTHN